jgi:hypothetical protein
LRAKRSNPEKHKSKLYCLKKAIYVVYLYVTCKLILEFNFRNVLFRLPRRVAPRNDEAGDIDKVTIRNDTTLPSLRGALATWQSIFTCKE